jgi:hypothetical protein
MKIEIKCMFCNKLLVLSPSVAAKKHFCSSKCYRQWVSLNIRGTKHPGYKSVSLKCEGCEKQLLLKPHQIKNGKKFCSHACYSNSRKGKQLTWIDYTKPRSLRTGGKTTISGYPFIKCNEHPRATKGGYIAEHILVVEAALGKYLPTGAVVHHVNGVRTDNRPDNLVICQDNNYHFLLHNRQNKIKKENGI